MFVVFPRLETEQRKLEAILSAARLGVTNPRVAPGFRQHRNDIVNKAHRALGFGRTGTRQSERDRRQEETDDVL